MKFGVVIFSVYIFWIISLSLTVYLTERYSDKKDKTRDQFDEL